MNNKCLIQGYEGSFHEAAMRSYFGTQSPTAIPCDSFDILAKSLDDGHASIAIMAIENSIAGSILQNYRILREHQLQIIGEQYLQINHQLMAQAGQSINDINEVISHPMAINQCLDFLNQYPKMVRTEYSDTALAAKDIASNSQMGVAAIASSLAAEIYGLEILAGNIETVDSNYTRFFIVQKERVKDIDAVDKSSIYIKIKHQKGSLLEVLKIIDNCDINLSKLQSFPVLGRVQEYYFYLDLEFDDMARYHICLEQLRKACLSCEVMGEYKKAAIPVSNKLKSVLQ